MKRSWFYISLFVLAARSLSADVIFEPAKEGKNIILEKLIGAAKEPFRMGWLLPPDRLILVGKFENIQIFSKAAKPLAAKFEKVLTSAEIASERKKNCVACDPQASYYQYRVVGNPVTKPERVFVTTVEIPDVQTGSKPVYRTKFLLKKAAGILGIKKGQLHKYLYLQTPDGKFAYSFHAFYDPKSKELKRAGAMLEKRGVLIATTAYDFDPTKNCDGCPVPNYKDPLEEVYGPIGLIQTSALPCPIVLMDTSTNEGRALSLVTFDLDGTQSEMRAYEYVVNCCR